MGLAARHLFVSVLFSVRLCGLRVMMNRLLKMAVRSVGVMRCFLMRVSFMVLGCFAVMPGGMFMMFGGLVMMGCSFFRHMFCPSVREICGLLSCFLIPFALLPDNGLMTCM